MNKKLLLAFILIIGAYISGAQVPQLWGMASEGGAYNAGSILEIYGNGSGFNATPLLNISGGFPGGHLVLEKNNLFYGMTFSGGANRSGTLFSFNPTTNKYYDIYDIDSTGNTNVFSDLVPVGDSMLYGILREGGPLQMGAIFSFNYITHAYQNVFEVTDTFQGWGPRNMSLAANNKLYGTTDSGGLYGFGVIFSFDPTTNSYTDVHDFDSINGASPLGAMAQGENGLLYGLTGNGGANSLGVLFSFDTADDSFVKLYDFQISVAAPYGNNTLVRATNNLFYCVSMYGGAANDGTIFSFNPVTDSVNTLFEFNGLNGAADQARLIQASDGNLYGITTAGGVNDTDLGGDGVIFRFDYTDTVFTKLTDLLGTTGSNAYGYLTEYINPLAIRSINNAQALNVYPNPANNRVIIQAPQLITHKGEITVSIINTLGQVVSMQSPGAYSLMTLDISTLGAGLYYIDIRNGDNAWLGKFVKE